MPEGWSYEIAGGAESVTLDAGESRDIPVKIVSGGVLEPGKSWHLKVAAYTMEPALPPPYVHVDRVEYHPKIAGGVDFAAQAVEESKIILNVSQRDTIVVDGRLDPLTAKAQLTIDYTLANGEIVSHLVTTDNNGAFHDATVQTKTGVSTVRAFWQGSATLSSAVSDLVTPTPATTTVSWPFVVVVLLVCLLLVLLYLFRRRFRAA